MPLDQQEVRNWSAMVFGSPLCSAFNEKEMMVLAKRGGAVSPVTSYLSIEPGVRPSTEGLEKGEAFGTIGHGSGSGAGHGFGTGHGRLGGRRFDPQAWLLAEIGRGWQTCGGAGKQATVTLESTSAEVVDVPSITLSQGADAKLESCLREVVWNLDLPGGFDGVFETWSLSVS
jgi:hypothetical protein